MSKWLSPVLLTACLLGSASVRAAENKATLTVPASAVVPSGPDGGPDDGGGFAVRVTLAAVQVKASRCPVGKPSLELQMPDTVPTRDGIDLSAAQKQVARKKADFYKSIMARG